jgi:hypothetical protein
MRILPLIIASVVYGLGRNPSPAPLPDTVTAVVTAPCADAEVRR